MVNDKPLIRDYMCDRVRLMTIWTRHPESPCVSKKNMKEIVRVEALSNSLQETYGFNLIHVSTTAAMTFIRIRDETIKQKILKKLEPALKASLDPITGEVMSVYGITNRTVLDLIELTKTGKISPKAKPKLHLTSRDIDLLDVMRGRAISVCKNDGEREAIVALYKKIRGIESPSRANA